MVNLQRVGLEVLPSTLERRISQRHDRLSTSFVEIGYNSPNLSNQLGLVSKCSLCSDLQGEDDFPELNRRWFGPIRNFLSWFTCYGQASLFPFPFALDQWEKIAALTLPYRKSCVSHEKSLIERLRELYPSRWQAVMSLNNLWIRQGPIVISFCTYCNSSGPHDNISLCRQIP